MTRVLKKLKGRSFDVLYCSKCETFKVAYLGPNPIYCPHCSTQYELTFIKVGN